MIIDGERIKQLVKGGRREIILCAPFIKLTPLKILFGVISPEVPVVVTTRWRPNEVAAGVSDLSIFEFLNDRPNAKLQLLDELHAKLYLADEEGLAGSANLTGAALGWSNNPNVELQVKVRKSDQDVVRLLERLASATPATYNIKAKIEELAAKIKRPQLGDDYNNFDEEVLKNPWLPKCAAPDQIYNVYCDLDKTKIVSGTRLDAERDLNALLPPKGLDKENFYKFIAATLLDLPGPQKIIDKIPSKLTDEHGVNLISELNPAYEEFESQKQWEIVRDWIQLFFKDRFEVAPESFVIRLK